MPFELKEKVFVVKETFEGGEPCKECGLSDIKRVLCVVEAEISDVLIHLSTTDDEDVKYRVRVDDEVDMELTAWREESKIFKTTAEAEAEIERLKNTLSE